jgi:hypothetical protein
VISEGKTRQKLKKKQRLLAANEHFEPIFNDVLLSAIKDAKVSESILHVDQHQDAENNLFLIRMAYVCRRVIR